MTKPADELDLDDDDELSILGGTLHKPVIMLAFRSQSMPMTVTARRCHNVMLKLSQTTPADADGAWSHPVASIMRGYGSRTKASERVQRYIELMAKTVVIYRPLAGGDDLFGATSSAQDPSEEARTFTLLSEARLFRKGRDWWVRWWLPPTIAEQIQRPDRWAQIDMAAVARLSTYTALALYEIAARYKDSPGHLTSRHPPAFWLDVLREGGELKQREYRKFKSEQLVPAISEINAVTDIHVKLVEHRTHGVVDAIQFEVTRRAKDTQPITPIDVSIVEAGQALGIREVEVDELVAKFGETLVSSGLAALAHQVTNKQASIGNRYRYLQTTLRNAAQEPDAAASQAALFNEPTKKPATEDQDHRDRALVLEAWQKARRKELEAEFLAISTEDKTRWLQVAQSAMETSGRMLPAHRLRFSRGQWDSPLILPAVLDAYALGKYGPSAMQPSETDLMLFTADWHKAVEANRE